MTSRRAIASPRALLTPAGLHILLALSDEERHGSAIRDDVAARTGGALRLGPATLYEAIHRMENAGWIAPRTPGDAPDDARRRYYTLTAEGRRQMTAELERLDAIVADARSRALLPRRTGS